MKLKLHVRKEMMSRILFQTCLGIYSFSKAYSVPIERSSVDIHSTPSTSRRPSLSEVLLDKAGRQKTAGVVRDRRRSLSAEKQIVDQYKKEVEDTSHLESKVTSSRSNSLDKKNYLSSSSPATSNDIVDVVVELPTEVKASSMPSINERSDDFNVPPGMKIPPKGTE
jgi:hypothetical protein